MSINQTHSLWKFGEDITHFLSIFVLINDPFLSKTFTSQSCKNSENINLLKSKLKTKEIKHFTYFFINNLKRPSAFLYIIPVSSSLFFLVIFRLDNIRFKAPFYYQQVNILFMGRCFLLTKFWAIGNWVVFFGGHKKFAFILFVFCLFG